MSLNLRVEVQHQELGLLCPVPGAHGAHELGGAGPDPPDHAPRAPGVQGDQVPDELTCPHVPELDRAIIAAGDHKLVIELQTRDSRLVFVGT